MPNVEDYNQELSDQIVAIVEQGNRYHQDHKWDQALDQYTEAWALLPEPIAHWDLTEWIASCKVSIYIDQQDYQQAHEWALIAVEAVKDNPRQTSAKMNAGITCYEIGAITEAYRWFEQAHQWGSARAFQGFDRKYLQFYTQMRPLEQEETQ